MCCADLFCWTTVISDLAPSCKDKYLGFLVADLFLFCYESDSMMSLSDDKQANIIDAFNTTSRYLEGILNIGIVYLDIIVSQIYHSELQLDT